MSPSLAIAAVTAALSNRLSLHWPETLSGAQVTTKPPHKARGGNDNGNQLNVFLYQAVTNTARRQQARTKVPVIQSSAPPPLALNLYYLITAYGKNDDDFLGHQLLGHAMGRLQAQNWLQPEELEVALETALDATSTDHDAFQWPGETLRIAPHAQTEKELTEAVGAIFQTCHITYRSPTWCRWCP
jgi:hypothetical protein